MRWAHLAAVVTFTGSADASPIAKYGVGIAVLLSRSFITERGLLCAK